MNPAVNRIMAEGNLGLQTFWVPQVHPHVVPKAIQGCRSAAVSYLFTCPKKIVWKCVAKLLTKVHHRDHIHHGNCSDGQLPETTYGIVGAYLSPHHGRLANKPPNRQTQHFCQDKSYCELKLRERRGKVETTATTLGACCLEWVAKIGPVKGRCKY